MKVESVDNETMKTLNLQESKVIRDALKTVEGLEDEIAHGDSPMGDEAGLDTMPPPEGMDMPIEPAVSDSALGASTEDNVALGLMREIRDLLAQIAGDEEAEGGEAPGLPIEGEDEGDEEGPHDGEEGATEEEGEQFRPGKRPMPISSGAE